MAKIVHPRAVATLAATAAASAFVILSSKSHAARAFAPNPLARPSPSSADSRSSTSLSGERNNPLASFLGDAASSLFGGASSLPAAMVDLDNRVAERMSDAGTAQTWDSVRAALESKQTTDDEMNFRKNLAKGYGPASPLHKLRLYDESNKEEDVRVTLYRDSASWCPYCHKVWMTLEEKRIPYRIEKINMRCYGEKPASFNRLQPSGAIPVAIIDGTVFNQSNDIIYALEGMFPEHKLNAADDERNHAQGLLRLERKLFGSWMNWLTGRDFSGRQRNDFTSVLQEVEDALSSSKGGDFFLGDRVTLVDIMFAPFFERACASLLFFKGFQIRVAPGEKTDFPAVNRWFDAMETLESYRLTKSDYYTHCWDLPPQLGGCTFEDVSKPYESAINGLRNLDGNGGSWELPLQPHNGGIEPDWEWCNGDEAKREAVERVSANFENIVKFAARGAGKKGFPPYGAPLADPNAVPDESIEKSVDASLRIVCAALLEGVDDAKCDGAMKDVAELLAQQGDGVATESAVASLAYLRDRVGVPRDMRLPAARELRAHLNWAIGKILEAQKS